MAGKPKRLDQLTPKVARTNRERLDWLLNVLRHGDLLLIKEQVALRDNDASKEAIDKAIHREGR